MITTPKRIDTTEESFTLEECLLVLRGAARIEVVRDGAGALVPAAHFLEGLAGAVAGTHRLNNVPWRRGRCSDGRIAWAFSDDSGRTTWVMERPQGTVSGIARPADLTNTSGVAREP